MATNDKPFDFCRLERIKRMYELGHFSRPTREFFTLESTQLKGGDADTNTPEDDDDD